jgi:hypothetical protein
VEAADFNPRHRILTLIIKEIKGLTMFFKPHQVVFDGL